MASALDRLKARLGGEENLGIPLRTPLTKLTEPTQRNNSPIVAQPQPTFVSFVSGVLGDTTRISAPPPVSLESLNRELYPCPADRPMRVAWQGWTEHATRSERELMTDLAFWRGHHGEVPEACPICGDGMFYRLAERSPWRCRTCEPVDARLKVQWLPAGGGPVARSAARQCDAPGCDRPACAWGSDRSAWCDDHGREWLGQQREDKGMGPPA